MLDHVRPVPVVEAADLEADMHGTFATYRATHPLIALAGGGYVVLRYADVERLMSDPRLQATETALPHQAGLTKGALFDLFEYGMLTANRETHARRRAALSRALARESLEHFRQHVRDAASLLIDARIADGRLELVSAYARQLPILALARLLDVTDDALPTFERDVLAMNAFFRPGPTPDAVAAAEEAALRLQSALADRLDQVDAERPGSFLSTYKTTAGEHQLSPLEGLMQIVQMIIGGTESMRTALVVEIAQLLGNRNQWESVCSHPTLVANAVAEALRFDPGIAGVVRVAVEEIDLGGWIVPAGHMVLLSAVSALRDERVFADPHRFDLSRPSLNLARLAFGGGAHRCVAEAFGRAALEEGLAVLTERLPTLRLEHSPTVTGHVFVRETSECWVRWQH
ncbi:cytochrome P450 [Rhizobium sp. YIM 134829]|uniref:cytochrome P450 n=1 Tax=Rhizobium sp. YIM 134829 TaxID=3390453 RepID=UPI00397D6C27